MAIASPLIIRASLIAFWVVRGTRPIGSFAVVVSYSLGKDIVKNLLISFFAFLGF
jgi:hypothetical protein